MRVNLKDVPSKIMINHWYILFRNIFKFLVDTNLKFIYFRQVMKIKQILIVHAKMVDKLLLVFYWYRQKHQQLINRFKVFLWYLSLVTWLMILQSLVSSRLNNQTIFHRCWVLKCSILIFQRFVCNVFVYTFKYCKYVSSQKLFTIKIV